MNLRKLFSAIADGIVARTVEPMTDLERELVESFERDPEMWLLSERYKNSEIDAVLRGTLIRVQVNYLGNGQSSLVGSTRLTGAPIPEGTTALFTHVFGGAVVRAHEARTRRRQVEWEVATIESLHEAQAKHDKANDPQYDSNH